MAERRPGDAYDVVIIGAGPAGMTAAIYGVRSGMKVLLLEAMMAGGQVSESPLIENYPGFPKTDGPTLIQAFRKHVEEYTVINEGEEVVDVAQEGDLFRIKTDSAEYASHAIIFATGARHKKLGVPGEEEFAGRGVSYCATCDGFFFRGKKVIVVGGGNTALTEAIYLLDTGVDVTVVHRRDEFRADCTLSERYFARGGKVIWNSVVEEIKGDERVRSVVLRNRKDGSLKEIEVDGVFVSVGIVPNSDLAVKLGVAVDQSGYIITDKQQRTNIPRVFAAGDVTGGVRQIVTGCGEGAVAAITAYEEVTKHLWGQ